MSDQITWYPRLGSAGDDKYAWPQEHLMVAGPGVSGNQTIPTVNAKTHFAQIQAEITRRSQIVGYDTAYVPPGATVDRRILTPRMIFAAQNIRLKESLARFDFGANLQFNFGTTSGARPAGALFVSTNVPYDPDWANISTAYFQFRNHDKVYKVTAWTRTRVDFTPGLQTAVPASTQFWMFVRPERMIEQEFALKLRKALSEQPQGTLGGTVWAKGHRNYQVGGPVTYFAYEDGTGGDGAFSKIGGRVFYGRGYVDAPIPAQYLEYLLQPYTNAMPWANERLQGPVIQWGGFLWGVFSDGNRSRVCRSTDGATWETMYAALGPFAPPSYPRLFNRGLTVGTAAPLNGLSILGYKSGSYPAGSLFIAYSADGVNWSEIDMGMAQQYQPTGGFHFQMPQYQGGPDTWWIAASTSGGTPPFPYNKRYNPSTGVWDDMTQTAAASECLSLNYFVRTGTNEVVSYAGYRYVPPLSVSTKGYGVSYVGAGSNLMNCVVGNALYSLQNVAGTPYKTTITNLLYKASVGGAWTTAASWTENMPVGQNGTTWLHPWFIEGCSFW
ncbi:MAG: hypothetical protein NTW87_10920 [Planctomycetota bacterium]|nr:hypothetical protein [Planctomycetota bacterium]